METTDSFLALCLSLFFLHFAYHFHRMTPRIFDFECALITGGAGGLGYALAEYFLSLGKKVVIVGRTEEKLKAASAKLKDAPFYVLDAGQTSSLPATVERILQEHPEIDCLVNNAGVQRPLDVINLDLAKADNEIDIVSS